MDTLGFWLPIFFLFASALVGTALRRKVRDHCLGKFHGSDVVLPNSSNNWEIGRMSVFARGIELKYDKNISEEYGEIKSLVLHPNEVDQIPYFVRPSPLEDTPQGYAWRMELKKIQNPGFVCRVRRLSLNLFNMLRDAFGQAMQTIIGAINRESSLSNVKNSDKRMNEIQSGLTELVPNAWEPILEKYRGYRIIIERKTNAGLIKESGILEDYSSKFILLRQVIIRDPDFLAFWQNRTVKKGKMHDILYSRKTSMIRHTVE